MKTVYFLLAFALFFVMPAYGGDGDHSRLGIGQVDDAQFNACAKQLEGKTNALNVFLKSFGRSICRPDDDSAKTVMIKGNSRDDAIRGSVSDIRSHLGGEGSDKVLIDDYLLLFGVAQK